MTRNLFEDVCNTFVDARRGGRLILGSVRKNNAQKPHHTTHGKIIQECGRANEYDNEHTGSEI